jgi:hypothetical protein
VSNPNVDTRFSLLNLSENTAYATLFFVIGTSGASAAITIELVGKQMMWFNVVDVDPDITGYLVAVACDANGFPVNNNVLAGSCHVATSDGFEVSHNAFGLEALSVPSLTGNFVTLNFNDTMYERLPDKMVAEFIPSLLDGYTLRFVQCKAMGNYATGVMDAITQTGTGQVVGSNGLLSAFTGYNGHVLAWTNTNPRISNGINLRIPSGLTGGTESQPAPFALFMGKCSLSSGYNKFGYKLSVVTKRTSNTTMVVPVVPLTEVHW